MAVVKLFYRKTFYFVLIGCFATIVLFRGSPVLAHDSEQSLKVYCDQNNQVAIDVKVQNTKDVSHEGDITLDVLVTDSGSEEKLVFSDLAYQDTQKQTIHLKQKSVSKNKLIVTLKWDEETEKEYLPYDTLTCPSPTLTETPAPTPKPTKKPTPTPTITPKPTEAPTPTVTSTPMLTPTPQAISATVDKYVKRPNDDVWHKTIGEVHHNDTLDFQLIVVNTGDTAIKEMTLTDVLPDNLFLQGDTKTWVIKDLKPDEVKKVTLQVSAADTGIKAGDTHCVTNIANLFYDGKKIATSEDVSVCISKSGQVLASINALPETAIPFNDVTEASVLAGLSGMILLCLSFVKIELSKNR